MVTHARARSLEGDELGEVEPKQQRTDEAEARGLWRYRRCHRPCRYGAAPFN